MASLLVAGTALLIQVSCFSKCRMFESETKTYPLTCESAASTGCPTPSLDTSSSKFSRGGTRLSPTYPAPLLLPRSDVGHEWSALRPRTGVTRNWSASVIVHDSSCELLRRRFLHCPRSTQCCNSEKR